MTKIEARRRRGGQKRGQGPAGAAERGVAPAPSLSRIAPLLLCGGAGARLWPVSRAETPKQFLPILDDRSLYQQTLLRLAATEAFDAPIVVTIEPFRFLAAEQARAIGVEVEIVLEPEPHGGAMAVAVGAEILRRRSPDTLTLAISADHSVLPGESFVSESLARTIAERSYIVTFGVLPTAPETRFDYIEPGDSIGDAAHRIGRVVGCPDQSSADDFVRKGYLWNSGILLFQADVMMNQLARSAPRIALAASRAVDGSRHEGGVLRLHAPAYAPAPRSTIDDVLRDAQEHIVVAPVACARSDVATWSALWQAADKDGSGNAVIGDAELLDTSGCVIHSRDGVLTTVLGGKDLIIVATDDVTLVAERARAEEVKGLVRRLAAEGRREARAGRRASPPWGAVRSVDRGDRYQVKRITVEPGRRLSLQRHYHRAEHWVVVRGVGEIIRDGESVTLRENESIHLPQGCVHRIGNPGRIPLELIEVQVGAYLEEDDVVRIEDDYDRGTPE